MILDFTDLQADYNNAKVTIHDFTIGLHSSNNIEDTSGDFIIRFKNYMVKIENGTCKKLHDKTFLIKGDVWKPLSKQEIRKIRIDDIE